MEREQLNKFFSTKFFDPTTTFEKQKPMSTANCEYLHEFENIKTHCSDAVLLSFQYKVINSVVCNVFMFRNTCLQLLCFLKRNCQ